MPPNKPWELNTHGRRPTATRERRRVLIICEDTKSSCLYFKLFPVDVRRAEVVALGTGMNTDSLVTEAIKRKQQASKDSQPYNEVWCVFDRDSFPLQNYARAFELARGSGIKVAWANEAFELWYLLHFNYHDTALSRSDYQAKLRPYLEYSKADAMIYEKMKPFQTVALRNARKLERYWNECGEKSPQRQNPSTNIHKLVEFLNELTELGSTD